MPARAWVVLAAILAVALPARADEAAACATSSQRVGPCVTVHGRLTTCTGIPNARIWIVGTRRVLGIEDAAGRPNGDHLLPSALQDRMFGATPCSLAAFGDFTVCPLTPQRPGVMQYACVIRATHIVIRDW